MKKSKRDISCLTSRELATYICETGTIPIPDYSKVKRRDLIVQSRSIWDMKRVKRRTRKKKVKF